MGLEPCWSLLLPWHCPFSCTQVCRGHCTHSVLSEEQGAKSYLFLHSSFSLFLPLFSQRVTASVCVAILYLFSNLWFLFHRCFPQLLMGRLKWRLKCARERERWLVTTNCSASSRWYVSYSVFITLDLPFLEQFKAFSVSVDP